MIFRRPSFRPVSLLIAILAGAATAHAESSTHASPPTDPVPPADTAPQQVAAPAPVGPALVQPVGENAPHPAVQEPAATEAVHPAAPGPVAKPAGNAPDDAPHKEVVGLQVLGANLTEHGDWEGAEIAFRQVLIARSATAEDLANSLIGLARVYRRQGALTKAAAIYERFLKDYPAADQVPDALLELGRTQRALGSPQLALSRFYSVINSTLKVSGEGFAHYQMLAKTAQFEIAETHFQLGEFAEANKFFSRLRLLDLAPADRARAHFKSAYALYLGNDFTGAVTTLHSYLDQWPKDENVPEARYLLSLSLRSLGRKQEALDATLQLLRAEQTTDPKRWAYWQRRTGNQLANDFFQNGDTLSALAIYQGLAALAPDAEWRLPITYQIGLCYERMRLSDRASAAYQTIIDYVNAPATPKTPSAAKPNEPDAPKPVTAEMTELARMAAWRIGQISWHDQTEHQLTSIFSTTEEVAVKSPPAAHSAVPNLEGNAASLPANPITHDNPGNPASAPPGL